MMMNIIIPAIIPQKKDFTFATIMFFRACGHVEHAWDVERFCWGCSLGWGAGLKLPNPRSQRPPNSARPLLSRALSPLIHDLQREEVFGNHPSGCKSVNAVYIGPLSVQLAST